jgi:RES domain-containing protein
MDVETTSISGIWWRQIPGGGDVHYEPDPPADSRWQKGEVVDAHYFADTEDTAWAEWYRAIAESGLPPGQALPRDLWQWEISLPDVADLSTTEKLNKVGLKAPSPTRNQWPECQAVGEALYAEGWPALLAPSAARPDGRVLCLFRAERIVAGATPVPPPQTYEDPPRVPQGMTT